MLFRSLADVGAERFLEVGAGSMLAALARRTVPAVEVMPVAVPEDLAGVRP